VRGESPQKEGAWERKLAGAEECWYQGSKGKRVTNGKIFLNRKAGIRIRWGGGEELFPHFQKIGKKVSKMGRW